MTNYLAALRVQPRVYSAFDFAGASSYLPIYPEGTQQTAVYNHNRTLQCTFLQFGLVNAPAQHHRYDPDLLEPVNEC